MRVPFVFLVLVAAACGGSTDTGPTRYNFKVIRGLDQVATAGSQRLGSSIVSQLATAPDGQFVSRPSIWSVFRPKVAFAQSVTVKGTPVVGGVVCAPIPKAGEPAPFAICTNTLADGTAPFAYAPGTKAGTYNIKFVAQTETASLVTDSTTLTVEPGPPDPAFHVTGNPIVASPALIPATAVVDRYGNAVPFYIVADANLAVGGGTAGTDAAHTITFKGSADPNGTTGMTELRDAGGLLVGHLSYRIYPSASTTQPSLSWQSGGTAIVTP